jgi:hypothetical protein
MNENFTPPGPLNTAVLFLVFNRPDTTSRVFEAIRQAKPPRLYVAADGARAGRIGEAELVAQVREIATAVDWPCEVKTLFRDQNLGCKYAVSGAITWFFDHEEWGIILEDDCLPHPDFFGFCQDLLKRYEVDDRISAITGNNFQNEKKHGNASYYFSKYVHIWGWATWRRVWRHYQVDLEFWPDWRASVDWADKNKDKVERQYWEKMFDRTYAGRIDTWDYQWTACVWKMGGLTATPKVNLVSNIGFGKDATHTTSTKSDHSELPTKALGNITHPECVKIDFGADRWIFDFHYDGRKRRFPGFLIFFPRRVAVSACRKLLRFLGRS